MVKRILLLGCGLIVFAFSGLYLLLRSSAATSNLSLEPEQGTITSPATIFTESGASNGSYVNFLAPATPPASLIWQDTFDSSLDLSTATRTGAWRPNDFWQDINKGYRDFAGSSWNLNPNETPAYSPFSISSGILSIKAQRTPATLNSTIAASMAAQQQSGSVPAWSGGILITDKRQRTFGYGYYEFKARFPTPGKGMFPALWLYSADGTLNPGKEGAEIDILEIFGYADGTHVDSTVHFLASNNVRARASFNSSIVGDTASWHTYALDWQPTYMRFYKDNALYAEMTGDDAAWYNGVRMGIRMNYAMDAPWFGVNASDATTPSPLSMDIDYIKVYTSKP